MLLSVIVPIYNGEKTLPGLIEPVLSINRNDIEFILVDDGSADKSKELCEKYAQRDKRVVPLHIENSGVSAARNAGLNIATGKYIYFCDCDDFVFTDTLKEILPILENDSYDLITADYIYKHTDTGETKRNNTALPHLSKMDKQEIIDRFISPLVLRSGTGLASLCNKFFRLYLIKKHSLEFNPKVHKGEDWQFILNFLSFAESAYYIPEVLYEYRLDGSQTESKYKREPGMHMLTLTGLKMQLAEKFNIKVSEDQFAFWCADIMQELVFAAKSGVSRVEWNSMAEDNSVLLSVKTLKRLKTSDYLRLEISRKYKIYSLLSYLGAKRFLRYFIKRTDRS